MLALVGKPRVAFLDEPTAGVDVQGRQLIRSTVRELAHDGVCVILTTHDLDEAEKVSDRVVIIDRGPPDHRRDAGSADGRGGSREIRFGAPAGIDTAALGKVMLAAVHERSPGEYLIETEPSPANIATLTGWLAEKDLPLAGIRAGRQTLEDVFLRMTAITGEVPAVRLDQRAPEPAGRGDRHHRGRRRPGAA